MSGLKINDPLLLQSINMQIGLEFDFLKGNKMEQKRQHNLEIP
jgi:hypothetical protein